MDIRTVRKKLAVSFDAGYKKDAKKLKIVNIEAIKMLDRKGLVNGRRERTLSVHTCENGEKVLIQFPGKEAIRNGNKKRPWDFRPKVLLSDGKEVSGISFEDIWEDLVKIGERDSKVLPILAAVFYRMAFMVDHDSVKEKLITSDIDIVSSKKSVHGKTELKYYKYAPDKDIIRFLQKRIGDICGMSVEAFLYVCDCLAQNEDCMYYYSNVVLNGKSWNPDKGRSNNLLTHVFVIGYLEGNVSLSKLLARFNYGVSPIPDEYVQKVTDGLVILPAKK
jgi:hypothetical protein